MASKLYNGNKVIYLVDPVDKGGDDGIPEGAIRLRSLKEPDVASFLSSLQDSGVTAGVINHSLEEALNALKNHFTVVEAAGGFILNEDDEILMIFRRGKWDLPKGKVDDNETLESCALREVEEETGVKANITGYLATTYHTYVQNGEAILKVSHWFRMKAKGSTLLHPQTEEDIESCIWVNQEGLSSYFEGAHGSIRDVLQKGLEKNPA